MSEMHGGSVTQLLLEDQRVRWQRGEPALVESYLAQRPSLADDVETVLELILNEVLLRQERGESPALESYRQRFPHLAEQLEVQFEVEAFLERDGLPVPDGLPPTKVHDPTPQQLAGQSDAVPAWLGRYQIVGRIGAGGMGVVYRAHDAGLRRDVAVKAPLFHGPEETRAAARLRFLREARAAAAIRHPNVCPIYDVGEDAGRPYVVMALVEGESLGDRLERKGRSEDQREAVALVVQVAEALAAVHAAHVVHRDVKPGNILLDRAGVPLLSDFGLAHAEDGENLSAVGVLMGTPTYMAPEQAAFELGEVGPWSDQYSLAVVLYHLLAGRPPFEGSVSALIYQVGARPAPPPSRHRPDLDPVLEQVLMKALSRHPRDRYPSVTAFADALRAWGERPVPPAAPRARHDQQIVPQDAEARALYRKARHFWDKRTEDGLRKSIVLFNEALDREPDFALAWAGLADAYHQLGHWGLAPPGTAYPRGKSAAARAIELDESLTEAHFALAVILKDHDWDFAGAERVFRRALQQKPDHASGRQWYGQCLACMGRHEEALTELRRAQELDPLALIHDAVVGRHGYFFARQYDQAREQLHRALLTDPTFWIAQNFLGWVLLFQGDDPAAVAAFGKARELDDNPENLVALGYCHGVAGRRAEAMKCLDALTGLAPRRYVAPINCALVYTGLGDRDQAFTWLEKAREDHSQWLSEIRVDPAFDPLRGDPRFDALMQRMKMTLPG